MEGSNGSAPGDGILLGEQAAAMLETRAIQLGINCTSCGLEMSGPGFEFVSMKPTMREGRPTVVESRAFICHREDCAEAREAARARATAVRPAGGWEILTGVVGEHEEAEADGRD